MNTLGYKKEVLFKETYIRLQNELHYTGSQMGKEFPDLCKKIHEEECRNLEKDSWLTLNKIVKLYS